MTSETEVGAQILGTDAPPSTFGSSTQPPPLTAEPALDAIWHQTLARLRY